MEIEYDPAKDNLNREKHGISLAAAARLDVDTALVIADERFAYGKARFQAVGRIDGVLCVLAFTMRGAVLRAISLRRANAREVKRYGEKV